MQRLVDLTSDRFIIEPRYFQNGWATSPRIRAQAALARRLLRAQKKLPAGYRFKIWDCYRTFNIQQKMLRSFTERIAKLYPHATKKEREKLVLLFGGQALPKVLRTDTHRHGGAVDLTIVDAQGHELAMGTDHDDLTDRAATKYFEKTKHRSKQAALMRKNRRLLARILTSVGLRNYSREWWHWYLPLPGELQYDLDAIVVLSVDPRPQYFRKRVQLACKLYAQGAANALIFSGRTWGGKQSTPHISEARLMARYAERLGVPAKNIFLEEYSLETTGNFYFTKKRILEPNGFKKILIIAHATHMPKVKFLAKKVLGPKYRLSFMSSEKDIPHLKGHSTLHDIRHFFDHVRDGDTKAIAKMILDHPYYKKRNYAREKI